MEQYNAELEKRLGVIEQVARDARTQSAFVSGAGRNRAFVSGTGAQAPTATTNGMALIPFAAWLRARSSGIFHFSFTAAYTGWMTGETTVLSIQSLTAAPAIMTLSAAAIKTGPGFNVSGTTYGIYAGNAAGGIVVTGGAGSLTQYSSGTLVAATGGTTAVLSYTGTIQNSITAVAETPFTIGNDVLVTVTVNHSATTGAIAASAFNCEFWEEP